MKKIILIKYGELTTKKDNRNFFINTLKKNIKNKLSSFEFDIKSDYYRMFIYPKEEDIELILSTLRYIFGIYEIVVCYMSEIVSEESIKDESLKIMKKISFDTFKVITKRSDKSFSIDSMKMNNIVGGHILKNISNINVDVHNPDVYLNIEIRKEAVYYYESSNIIKGLGGYPVSTLGSALLMLSGGIDSPVAGYYALKRGIRIEAIYFESPPHTSLDAKNKVLSLARELSKYSGYIKIHIVNFTKIQEAIYKNCPNDYMITIMRRMMYRISERLSYKINAKVLINGESVGQVASQTLTSMKVINEVVKLPVLRPLACFDKLEIINIAKNINTYDISILPYEDCCTIFVPNHPVINPESKLASEYENLIPYEELINEAMNNIEVIKVMKENNKFTNIL